MSLGETPWVDQHLKHVWSVLEQAVPENLLPREIPQRAFSVEELGCGHFGCVMPTRDSSLVVKITTDESEAWFAYVSMELAAKDGWPPGIVRYHKVLKLEGHSHRRRPIYLLWRDEAWEVGFLRGHWEASLSRNLQEYDRWTALALYRMRKTRDPQKLVAQAAELEERVWVAVGEKLVFYGDVIRVNDVAEPRRNEPAVDFAFAVRACGTIAQFMANTYENDTVGTALEYYIDQGLLISDVHAGNVGKVLHEDYNALQPGITDPGLAIPTQTRWFDVRLPPDVRLYTS